MKLLVKRLVELLSIGLRRDEAASKPLFIAIPQRGSLQLYLKN